MTMFFEPTNRQRFRLAVIVWGFSALLLGGASWILFGNVCRLISALTVGGIALIPYTSQENTSQLTRIIYAVFGTASLCLIVWSGLPLFARDRLFDLHSLDLLSSICVLLIYCRICAECIACPNQDRPISAVGSKD
jgi:hypothetical protein